MSFPRVHGDSTVALATDGYRFGIRRFQRVGGDGFDTLLALRPVTFLRGSSAVRFFYEGGRFERDGALPASALHPLREKGTLPTLAGAAHARRKAMFLELLSAEQVSALLDAFRIHFLEGAAHWGAQDKVVLLHELSEVLTRAACDWAGVPLPEDRVAARSRELSILTGTGATVGPPDWRALAMRRRTERWAEHLITGVRDGGLRTRQNSPLEALARLSDENGLPLDPAVCAVELLNLLRPTVAAGRYLVFCAWALHQHPRWKARFAEGDDADLDLFVHEVRRFFPFIPVVGGRATRDSTFGDKRFKKGAWVMLDLYATNHSERLWPRPDAFLPQRFRGRSVPPHDLVSHGGGHADDGHRCPGEDPTNELMREGVRLFTRAIDYEVPEQDLRISLRRVPAAPQSGFVITDVRPRATTTGDVGE